MMNDDMALVREYATRQSEQAFASLVNRHVHLVHSAALRQARDPHLAAEVTQTVFLILARKAAGLSSQTILSGWLDRTAQFVAKAALKREFRRQRHEQEAHMQNLMNTGDPGPAWEQWSPLLDEAMAKLPRQDRDALILRYFENRSLREVGGALGVAERAAQKRVARGLEKLRGHFAKRGWVLTVTAIAGAVSAHSVSAAPISLAPSVTAAALAKGAAAGSTLALAKGALKLMAWSKSKIAAAVVVVALFATTSTVLIVRKTAPPKTYPWEALPLDGTIVLRTPPQVVLVPSKFSPGSSSGSSATGDSWIGINLSAEFILKWLNGWQSSVRMIRTTVFPEGNFDFISNLPQGSPDALRQLYVKKFGLTAHRESRDADVLLLRVKVPHSPGLKPGTGVDSWSNGTGAFALPNGTMASLANLLEENYLRIPIIDETGVPGKFDFELKWSDPSPPTGTDHLKQALLNQFGLELVPDHRPIEMLIVEKAD